jgi:flagellar motor switch protein FliM
MTPEAAYDVCNPDWLPAERVAFVGAIHQQFLQAFGQALTSYLDTPVEAAPAGIDQLPVAKFLEAGAGDACVIVLDLATTGGQAWVGLSGRLVFRVLDILLGAPAAPGGAPPAVRAAVTEIECDVLREFFDALVDSLASAWALSGITLGMNSIGSIAEVRQAADLEATALVLNCSVQMQDAEETFRVAVPSLAIRLAALPHEQKAAAAVAGETAQRTALLDTLGSANLQIEALLAGSSIRLSDLAAMKPGQILVLTQPAGSPLQCTVNGKTKFLGEWIVLGDRAGLQIASLVEVKAKQLIGRKRDADG